MRSSSVYRQAVLATECQLATFNVSTYHKYIELDWCCSTCILREDGFSEIEKRCP